MSDNTMVTIPEEQFAGLVAQAAILRAAVHALGGIYEVSFDGLVLHGKGEIEIEGHDDRRTVSIKLVQGPHEEQPIRPGVEDDD